MTVTASHALQARCTPAVGHVQRMRAGRTQVMLRRSSFRPEVKLAVRAFRPSAGRLSIATEANLFSRLFRIVRSTINSIVNEVEDPERLLDQVVQDMNDDVIRMRQASASALGSSKQLEKKYLSAQKAADEWFRRAEMAVQQGNEDLAREALARKKAFQKQADQLREQYTAQKQAVDSLVTNTRAIERKLDEARSKKETLKARAASAKSAKAVQEMVGSLDTSSAVAAFDKMEQKVMALEAEAESIGQLVAPDDIEQQFRKLEGLSVEDELEKMKRGVLADRGRSKLPQGRPIKDAIDLEIETIRLGSQE